MKVEALLHPILLTLLSRIFCKNVGGVSLPFHICALLYGALLLSCFWMWNGHRAAVLYVWNNDLVFSSETLCCFPNIYHKWVNPLAFDKRISQPFCPNWHHTDLSLPNIFWWKVTLVRAKWGGRAVRGTYWIFQDLFWFAGDFPRLEFPYWIFQDLVWS